MNFNYNFKKKHIQCVIITSYLKPQGTGLVCSGLRFTSSTISLVYSGRVFNWKIVNHRLPYQSFSVGESQPKVLTNFIFQKKNSSQHPNTGHHSNFRHIDFLYSNGLLKESFLVCPFNVDVFSPVFCSFHSWVNILVPHVIDGASGPAHDESSSSK
jgi:hypothetical protein